MTVGYIVFIGLTVLLAYVYAGYPALLFLVARFFPRPHRLDDRHEPSVTIVISAHNEEDVMGSKIVNTLELDYPADKLAVLVVSDASIDQTDEIVKTFEDRGVRLVRSPKRRGKTAALNLALSGVTSELIVFSDANAMYDRLAIRRLARHFADEKVGYAVGHARYDTSRETASGSSEGAYWTFEVKMKEWESKFSSVVGGDGAIYATRTQLYEPLQENDINDFVNPLQIIAKGYRGVFDPEAWCVEEPAPLFEKEFSRKVRIVNRSFNGLLRVPEACNPLKVGGFAWLLFSHKLLRWFSPFVICLHFIAALAVAGTGQPIDLVALLFVLFYGFLATLALVGWFQEKIGQSGQAFSFPYYFVLMNLASALGVLLRLRGRVISVWDTVRTQFARQNLPSSILPVLLVAVLSAVTIRISLILGFPFGFLR